MSMSPLCGRLANFYTDPRPVRQKFATATQNDRKKRIFCAIFAFGFKSTCKYAVKVDVDVSTLRPFGQFLYPGPPCASKIGLLQRIHAFFAVKVDVDVAPLRPFGQFLYRGPPSASKIGLVQRIHTFFCSKMASDCSWPLPSWTANFPNLAACQNLLVFKLNSL